MKYRFFTIILCVLFFTACKDDDDKRLAEQEKSRQKGESTFKNISENWDFKTVILQPKSENLVANWEQWRLFFVELNNKPTSTLGAFQKKSSDLTQKADDLLKSIPPEIDKPEIRSRFLVLLNHFRSLEMFISLDEIPEEKIILIISEINQQLSSIELQLDEFIRKSEIPMEFGESDMIRMLDTSRAVKEIPKEIIQSE
ncbi:MAG: hypothetical protein RBR78_08025 [Flavobacteriaceae bacterium]|jgi:hypothetical protein|nr:hypothetical protein [Flavobacteriaceae bacterium]